LKWAWFKKSRPLSHLESFNDGSQGPLGALKLIWALRGSHLIVTIGAFVTIIALAIDPFVQQLTRYYSCSQPASPSHNIASIPKTNLFYAFPGDDHAGAGEVNIGRGMQAAINAGIFSPGSTRVSATCPTGNCTFSPYKTMGYCTSCEDVTSELKIIRINDTETGNTTIGTSLVLPSGLSANASQDLEGGYYVQDFVDGNLEVILNVFTGSGPIFGDINSGEGNCSKIDSFPWYDCTGYGAARCSVSQCVRTYNASVEGTTFKEQEMPALRKNTADFGEVTDFYTGLDMSCLNPTEKTKLQQAGYHFNDTTQWLPYNLTVSAGLTPQQLKQNGLDPYPIDINPSCLYQAYEIELGGISELLGSIFKGQSFFGIEQNGQSPGNAVITQMNNAGNVSAASLETTMAEVADAMTAYIRLNSKTQLESPSTIGFQGQELDTTTCVQVRWWWLSLPVALLGLTLGFFVVMIIQTRSRDALASGTQNYKGSILPLMLHGLESTTTAKISLQRRGTMDVDAAREIQVRLTATDNGWKFVET
jgi:hypothetical protein